MDDQPLMLGDRVRKGMWELAQLDFDDVEPSVKVPDGYEALAEMENLLGAAEQAQAILNDAGASGDLLTAVRAYMTAYADDADRLAAVEAQRDDMWKARDEAVLELRPSRMYSFSVEAPSAVLVERISVAMTMPHNHPGIAGVADGDGCARCNAEHALQALFGRAEDIGSLAERPPDYDDVTTAMDDIYPDEDDE